MHKEKELLATFSTSKQTYWTRKINELCTLLLRFTHDGKLGSFNSNIVLNVGFSTDERLDNKGLLPARGSGASPQRPTGESLTFAHAPRVVIFHALFLLQKACGAVRVELGDCTGVGGVCAFSIPETPMYLWQLVKIHTHLGVG